MIFKLLKDIDREDSIRYISGTCLEESLKYLINLIVEDSRWSG